MSHKFQDEKEQSEKASGSETEPSQRHEDSNNIEVHVDFDQIVEESPKRDFVNISLSNRK